MQDNATAHMANWSLQTVKEVFDGQVHKSLVFVFIVFVFHYTSNSSNLA